MRLWLKDSERRPDPAPVKTDDRKAMLVGIALWLVALVIVLAFALPLAQQNNGAVLWTCIAGLALGLIGLVYTHYRALEQRESHSDSATPAPRRLRRRG